MVRVVDDGSHFEAPVDKVWKLIEAHSKELAKIHPNSRNPKQEASGENWGTFSWDSEYGRMKIKVSVFPPTAQVIEVLEGPFTGSKFMNYYTPKGGRTGVTVIGDFESKLMPENAIDGAARQFLDEGFKEDSAYLSKMK